jgi:hypothetical protein
MPAVVPVHGCEIGQYGGEAGAHGRWQALDGPPVPVAIAHDVWDILTDAALTTDREERPRVFRLLMPRAEPRRVVRSVEIPSVWRNERGILRWTEGGYPTLSEPLRKGGNAFIRGDVDLVTHDAWWMGREETDLRILLAHDVDSMLVSAWWARAGTTGLRRRHETDGEVLPVRLILD